MANGVLKGVYSQVLGCSRQLLLNKFFVPSAPSMRKGRDGGKTKTENDDFFFVTTNVVANRPLESRPTGMPIARAKKIWVRSLL